jgi:Ca2+-binding RTX toxin-like protein
VYDGTVFNVDFFDNAGTATFNGLSTFILGAGETFQNDGELKGSGTLDLSNMTSTFNNNGVITPGDGAVTGTLTINGSAILQESSELLFDLGGTVAGTQYDVLNFTGAATAFNGRLRVNTTFSPVAGNTFSVIATTAALAGDFTQIQGLDFSTGVVLQYQEVNQEFGAVINLVAVTVDLPGTSGDDLYDATTVVGTITGGLGNDDIFGVGAGDTVYGQDGDDIIRADLSFERVDGGDGVDTLELTVATADFVSTFIPAHFIDQIEILSLEGNGLQVLQLDETAIKQIVDGFNSFTGFDNDLFIVGDEGDLIELSSLTGDFAVATSVYLDPQNNSVGERFSVVEHQNVDVALFVDESVRLEVTRGDGSIILLGGSEDDMVDPSATSDYLDGRLGNDVIDGGAGDDEIYGSEGDDALFGGAGNDIISHFSGGRLSRLDFGGRR